MAEESSQTLNGVEENVYIVKFVPCLFVHSIDINNSLMIQRPTPTATARVVLPSPNADNDTDEEVEDGEAEEIDDGDFLADFPDDTEVRCYFG